MECLPLGTVEKVPSVIKSARRGCRRDPAVGGMAVRYEVRTGTPPRRDFASSTSPVPTNPVLFETTFSTRPLGRPNLIEVTGQAEVEDPALGGA